MPSINTPGFVYETQPNEVVCCSFQITSLSKFSFAKSLIISHTYMY